MSETLPAQTDTDSSMTFIAAKPATARHFISHLACALSSASARCGANGWGVITDRFDRRDDLGGVGLVVAPIDREPALREIDPRVDDAGHLVQAILDFSDAAGAVHAFDRQHHV